MSLYKNNPGKLRALLRKRDGDACFLCGNLIDFTLPPGIGRGVSVDHVIPRSAGGSNRIDNLRLAHMSPCNKKKGAMYNGVDHGGNTASPFGTGKHYRSKSKRRFGHDAPSVGDWDTPVLDCMPLFESWSSARR